MNMPGRKYWLALWRRSAPEGLLPLGKLRVRAVASDAAMCALEGWTPTWKTRAVAAILRHRGGSFVDVGANVGQTLLDFLAADARSRYVGFEPNLLCARHLSDLIALNGLECCEVIPAALGEHTCVADLYSYGGDVDSGATMRRSLRPTLNTIAVRTPVFRLDDLDSVTAGDLALIKIDVEGTELEVLRGMERTLTTKRPWVLCEVLHRDAAADPDEYRSRLAALAKFLPRMGYKALRIIQGDAAATLCGIKRADSFPDVTWHQGSELECDFLFVPAHQMDEAIQVLAA